MSGARRALVVASDAYDADGLRDLRSPRADATALAAVLGDPQVGDFTVDVVHNEPSYVVQAHVEELFAEARPDDLVLLHISCHGLKSESGELFFAARNTRLGRLESTAVPAEFVQRCMRSSRSRSIVLLLDCCYGGAFGTGVSVRAAGPVDVVGSFPAGRLEGGRGRAVITASSAMEYAFEGTTLADDRTAPSVFTEALVRGLTTGEADRDEDGWVSLNELYEYVFDQVRTSTPGQTPTRDVEMQGELYLARSRRRRVQPGPLPPDLLAASHDANVFTRLGAVSELRARLLGDNLPAAAGAHQRLAEMAEQDISYVAAAATAAIDDGALGCEPLEVSFGRVPQGAGSPVLRVTTTGPPLARTCALETSDPRIRVAEDGDGVAVSVDTSAVGILRGTVTLRGPLGLHLVQVSAEVVQEPADEPAPPAVAAPPSEPAHADGPVRPAEPVPPPRPTPVAPAESPAVPVQGPTPAAEQAGPDPAADPPDADVSSVGASRWAGIGGGVALGGAGLLLLGALADFQWDSSLRSVDPPWFWYSVLLALVTAAAAVMVLVERSRWPWGVGLVLGVGAASTSGLVTAVTAWTVHLRWDDGLEVGLWLLVAGHAVVVAGAVTVAARVLPGTGASFGRPEVPRWVVLALASAGAAAAVSILAGATRPDGGVVYWTIAVWGAVAAAAAPVLVAFVRPRGLRVWLLVGWCVGAGLGVVRAVQFYELADASEAARATTWAVVAVAALVPLAVVLARVGGPRQPAADTA